MTVPPLKLKRCRFCDRMGWVRYRAQYSLLSDVSRGLEMCDRCWAIYQPIAIAMAEMLAAKNYCMEVLKQADGRTVANGRRTTNGTRETASRR